MLKIFRFIIILLAFVPTLQGQDWQLVLTVAQQSPVALRCNVLENCQAILQDTLRERQFQGYLQASISKTYTENFTLYAEITLGKRFFWESFSVGNLPPLLATKADYKPKTFAFQAFNYAKVQEIFEKILEHSENTGYPFAQVQLTDLQIEQERIKASIDYISGPLIRFDTLRLSGNANISNNFLGNYLRIRPQKPFSQLQTTQIGRRIQNLPYLTLAQAPEIIFEGEQAFIALNLQKRRAGRIDGIVGILPNEEKPNEILFTGEFTLKVYNLFQAGKNLELRWQRLRSESQLLWFRYDHPAFLETNLGVQIYFRLLREDSSFVSNERSLSILYEFANTSRLRFEVSQRNSSAGAGVRFSQAVELPEFSEVNFLAYGLGYEWQNLDDIVFPTQGQDIAFKALVGEKQIRTNPLLVDSLYANLILNSTQFVFEGSITYYQPLFSRSFLRFTLGTGLLWNVNLFTNELFQVGGLTTLRGHNENTFFATNFVYSNFEYRVLLDRTSYAFVFYDQAFIQRKSIQVFQEDFPLGFGVGISLDTGTGIFQLVYALGKSVEQPLALNRAKIHFGFVARL